MVVGGGVVVVGGGVGLLVVLLNMLCTHSSLLDCGFVFSVLLTLESEITL